MNVNSLNVSFLKPYSNKVLVFRGTDNPLEIQDQYLSTESKNRIKPWKSLHMKAKFPKADLVKQNVVKEK